MTKSPLINEATVISIDTDNTTSIQARYDSIINALKLNAAIALTVEISSVCNLRCAYCGLHSPIINDNETNKSISQKQSGLMNYNNFVKVIDKCTSKNKIKVLYISGHGEPLLNKDLVPMIEYAKKSKTADKIVLITNGVLLDGSLLKKLDKAGLDEIRVSYDLFTAELYEKEKGRDLSHHVRSNLDECLFLLKSGIVNTTIHIECKYWVEKAGLNSETESIISYFNDKLTPGKSAIRISNLFDWSIPVEYNDRTYKRQLPCEQPFYMPFIHTDGDISACCLDTSKSMLVGNIYESESLEKTIIGNGMYEVRRKLLFQDFHQHDMCRSCNKSSCVDSKLMKNREEVLTALNLNR